MACRHKTASVASLPRPCLIENKPRNPQPPGHRHLLETAGDETRPTRRFILARLLPRSRDCEYQLCLRKYTPALLLLCRFCIRFGALFSRQCSFCFLYCDMYLRFRGCPVVLDIEDYVSAWYRKTRRARYAREVSSDAATSGSRQQGEAVCCLRHTFKKSMQHGAETTDNNPAESNTHSHRKHVF